MALIAPPNSDLAVGHVVSRKGYFTKGMFLRSQPPREVEKRLGFEAGRMRDGWWLLLLTELPGPNDFEVRGYSQMSNGIAQGHLTAPPDPLNAEQRLRAEGYDVVRIKTGLIRDVFRLAGPDRLAKAVPKAGGALYPQGSGIPQWELTRELKWRVAAFVPPGASYTGPL